MTTASPIHESAAPDELESAHKAVQAFAAAFKSYAIYPEDHVFCKTHLEKFRSQLQTFLETYGELPLQIEKNNFLYKGENIFDNPPEENNPAYLLTRDGVVTLSFLDGVEESELIELLKVFNRHRSGTEETGGDIVTSLWQAEFEHIEYDEVDIFALEAFNFDLGSLQVSPADANLPNVANDDAVDRKTIAEDAGEENVAERPESLADKETVSNLLDLEKTITVLELTPEEKATLKAYVEETEKRDYTNDVIDVLLIILVSQKNKLHVSQILEFIDAIFFDTLNSANFLLADKLCTNILNIAKQLKSLRPWVQEVIDEFMLALSSPEKWAILPWMNSPQVLMLNKNQLKYLWHVFRLLPSESIFALGHFIGKIDTSNIGMRNEVYELIEGKAKEDPEKFGTMLLRADEKVNTILFGVVDNLSRRSAGNIARQVLLHRSQEVRKMALDRYFAYTDTPDLEVLYPLLNDDNDVVVGKLLSFLLAYGEQDEVESMLLRYLEHALQVGVEHAHLFEYYKALSRCGTERTVKVLERILLESKVSEMFSNVNAVHKKGSALALRAIGSEEALIVLNKGKKSLRPDIRMACQFALEKMK